MAKTMRNIVLTCILLIVIAVAVSAAVLTGGCDRAFKFMGSANPFAGSQIAATNALIDASGIKDRIDTELRAHVGEISAETGIPVEVLEYSIDTLAIHDWQVTEKPAGAAAISSYTVDADGTEVSITAYEDPTIVSIGAYGQEVTLAIPESAQEFSWLIPYLKYAAYLPQ